MSSLDKKGLASLKFGDIIENGYASADNPTRIGVFIRFKTVPRGQINAGKKIECRSDNGTFWITDFGNDRLRKIGSILASVTPADVGEEPVAWCFKHLQHDNGWRYSVRQQALAEHSWAQEPLYSATALGRVVRDRDEWERRAGEAIMDEAAAIERATSAEAKLAEARKVIEWYGSRAADLSRYTNAVAKFDAAEAVITELMLDTGTRSRRFLEETK